MTKFKDLKVDDRFYVNEFGWPKEVYTRLPIFSDMSWNAQREDGSQTDIDDEYEVIKLGPSVDSDLGEAIHNYIKENLKISIEKFGKDYSSTSDKGIQVSLSLGDEIISQKKIYMWEYIDDKTD